MIAIRFEDGRAALDAAGPRCIDPQLETDLNELKRLGERRKRLAVPTTTFIERAPKECFGDCRDPVKIGVLGRTYCHFFAQYEDYTNTLRLEILQRQTYLCG
jgi:hypothetical protein